MTSSPPSAAARRLGQMRPAEPRGLAGQQWLHAEDQQGEDAGRDEQVLEVDPPGTAAKIRAAPAGKPSRAAFSAKTEPRPKPERKTNCSELSDRPQPAWIRTPKAVPAMCETKMLICIHPRSTSRRRSRGGRSGTLRMALVL